MLITECFGLDCRLCSFTGIDSKCRRCWGQRGDLLVWSEQLRYRVTAPSRSETASGMCYKQFHGTLCTKIFRRLPFLWNFNACSALILRVMCWSCQWMTLKVDQPSYVTHSSGVLICRDQLCMLTMMQCSQRLTGEVSEVSMRASKRRIHWKWAVSVSDSRVYFISQVGVCRRLV